MSTTTTPLNVSTLRAPLQAVLTALINGIHKDLASVDTFDLDGVPTKQTEVVTRLQGLLDAIATVKAQRTLLQTAVANQKVLLPQIRGLRLSMKRFLQTKFGPTSPKLQDFGFTQAHPGKATVAKKAAGQVQAKATRTARQTKGKKQKLAIKAPPPPATTAPSTSTPAAPKPATTANPPTTQGS